MRRRRNSRKQASGSLMLMLIVAAALLVFVPVRVTLAVGKTSTTVLDGPFQGLHGLLTFIGLPDQVASLVFPKNTQQMVAEAGSHYDIDSLSIFLNSSFLSIIITLLAGSTPPWAGLAKVFSSMDYLGVKALKATIDFMASNQSPNGFLGPFGSGPIFTTSSATTAQLRIVLLSVTVTGYKLASNIANIYGEMTIAGLNPLITLTLDRIFLDLFVDPLAGIAVYSVSADMTVYQELAMLFMTASL